MCYSGKCPFEYVSGDCKLKQPEKNCVSNSLPLDNPKAAQHHMHADGAVCAHANWVAVEESFYCFDCNSIITAPPLTQTVSPLFQEKICL